MDRLNNSRKDTWSLCVRRLPLCLGTAVLAVAAIPVQAQIQFEDVSSETHMPVKVESWGVSWGDLNGDNWPDIFGQAHRHFPYALRNTGDGGFDDIAYAIDPGDWINKPSEDQHGASFANFDNDDDDDLLIGVSATGDAQFLVNQGGGVFQNRSYTLGVSSDRSNRQPIWFDYTEDGNLDLAQLHLRGAYLRYQTLNGFQRDYYANFNCSEENSYGQLIDLDNDGSLELICAIQGDFPSRAYDVSQYPFDDITNTIPTTNLVSDSVVADFDNNGWNDIFMVRGLLRSSRAVQVNANRVEAWLRRSSESAIDKGFEFDTAGAITVTVDHTGMGKYTPSKVEMLDPAGPSQACFDDDGTNIVCIDYSSGTWRVRLLTNDVQQAYVVVESADPITNLVDVALDNPELPLAPALLMNGPGGMSFQDAGELSQPMLCNGAAAGDFNNDMHVDIYLVCGVGPQNLTNRIFQNQGDGTFVELLGHGAEGPVGVGQAFGVGDAAIVADYDVDGFLDLFVANGLLYFPWGQGGPTNLFHNTGNSNHWIEIDLQGAQPSFGSNRDGVGAKVYVTAGGVTQLREQNGGYHRWSQDDQRLHFGLGPNQLADVEIHWPSGLTDSYLGVSADTLYTATEDTNIAPTVLGPPVHVALTPGDECGEPPYHLDYGPALLLWRDCPSGAWHLRAKGGRENGMKLNTWGLISADAPFSEVSAYQLDGGDLLDNDTPATLQYSVGVWYTNDKGINFNTLGQSQSCFELVNQDIDSLIVGGSRKRIMPPFDLVSLGDCQLSPEEPGCGDPLFDQTSEPGFYAWQDCAAGVPGARWHFRAVGGGLPFSDYAGALTADMSLSPTGFSIEAHDTFDTTVGDQEVDFRLRVGGSGVDGFTVDVPDGASTCLDVSELPGGAQVLVGGTREVKSGAFNLSTLGACGAPPPPGDDSCGMPPFDQSTEVGVFVWRDCEAPGPGETWNLRITGGGGPFSTYAGDVTSDMTLTALGVLLESHDSVDTVPGDSFVDYVLKAGGSGIDGFTLQVPAGAQSCLRVDQSPGAQIELGAGRVAKGAELDLVSLGACN